MPIYEYVCDECGEEFDLLVFKLSEADQQPCPKCSSGRVSRKMSMVANPGGGCGESCSSSGAGNT